MKLEDFGIKVGTMKKGNRNSITDVKGVTVGHTTLKIPEKNICTGVTAVKAHGGNHFKEKSIAASYVINGFGKSAGLIQIDELGTLETPIILTNTLSVGAAHDGLVRYMLKENEDIGKTTGTVNPVVCECNDGEINDIRSLYVNKDHVFEALESTGEIFEEGDVGAGAGMICYGMKGGIGSASRIVELDDREYTLGILVLTNFGSPEDFILNGKKLGKKVLEKTKKTEDKGSIITIVATDIPLTSRQLKRVLKRVHIGIGRTGGFSGNGSGEIVVGFTTSEKIKHYEEKTIINISCIDDDKIDPIFKATVEATEEAILRSLINSNSAINLKGEKIYSLKEILED